MGIFNRFLLLLLSLATAASALIVLGIATGLVPTGVWQNELNFILSRYETLAVAVLVLLVSLKLIGAAFARTSKDSTQHKGEYLITKNDGGEVRIALDAVRTLVTRLASETAGVREARTQVRVSGPRAAKKLSVALALVVGREVNATSLTQALTATIAGQLAATMALEDVPLDIVITGVTDEPPVRKKRVV